MKNADRSVAGLSTGGVQRACDSDFASTLQNLYRELERAEELVGPASAKRE